ncbi:cell wall hydrolase [Brotaphodocola sp.]|uniref:cell wall hydrolase n=1 Tax=Brotaphodocola sp. TaxID=3073577 RepID=UPI003D7D4607
MLAICSFLQSVYQLVRTLTVKSVNVTKQMYRSRAILMTGSVVVAVLTFASAGFAGGGRNALTAYAETSSEEESPEETEEIEEKIEEAEVAQTEEVVLLTEAKIPFHLAGHDTEEVKSGQLLAGSTLAKNVQEELDARQLREEAVEETKEEIRRVEEERRRQEEEEARRRAEEERKRQEAEAKMAAAVVSYTPEDLTVLQRIVQAEAGGCDMKGRILVANVVINRVLNKSFPASITGVVYQKSQFSPVIDGSINRCKVTDATVEAVDRALAGEDYSQGALYFMNRKLSQNGNVRWFDGSLHYLFEHGGHEFFK